MNIDIKQKVILKVKYAGYKIIMEQIEGDFVHYRSIWSIIPQKNNTNMTIDTEFKVSFLKNLFVSKASLERKHKTFLENMTQQMDSGLYEHCTKKISIIWFKKDLRLYDNEALSSAAANGFTVGLFSLDNLRWNTSDLSTRHKVLLLKGLYELAKRLTSYRFLSILPKGISSIRLQD